MIKVCTDNTLHLPPFLLIGLLSELQQTYVFPKGSSRPYIHNGGGGVLVYLLIGKN